MPDKFNKVGINVNKALMELAEKFNFSKKLIITKKNEGELLLIKKNRFVSSVYIPSLFCIKAFPRA